eukprot:COSAG01_NODE_9235_length_2510_cov_82.915388_1_plen_322_part_00
MSAGRFFISSPAVWATVRAPRRPPRPRPHRPRASLIMGCGASSCGATIERYRYHLEDMATEVRRRKAEVGAPAESESEEERALRLMMESAQRLWERADRNGDGALGSRELQAILVEVGHPLGDVELARLIDGMDKNQNNLVEKGEFMHWFDSCYGARPSQLWKLYAPGGAQSVLASALLTKLLTKGFAHGLRNRQEVGSLQRWLRSRERDGHIMKDEFLEWCRGESLAVIAPSADPDRLASSSLGGDADGGAAAAAAGVERAAAVEVVAQVLARAAGCRHSPGAVVRALLAAAVANGSTTSEEAAWRERKASRTGLQFAQA